MSKLLELFLMFVKIGTVGFGGGPAMIPLIQREVVDYHHLLRAEEFVDGIGIGNSLPGPIAPKLALLVGYRVAGFWGVVVAVTGILLPSLLLMGLVVVFFYRFRSTAYASRALRVVRPVVVALLAMVVYDVWPKSVKGIDGVAVVIVSFVAGEFLGVHPAILIVVGAVLGLALYR